MKPTGDWRASICKKTRSNNENVVVRKRSCTDCCPYAFKYGLLSVRSFFIGTDRRPYTFRRTRIHKRGVYKSELNLRSVVGERTVVLVVVVIFVVADVADVVVDGVGSGYRLLLWTHSASVPLDPFSPERLRRKHWDSG